MMLVGWKTMSNDSRKVGARVGQVWRRAECKKSVLHAAPSRDLAAFTSVNNWVCLND
jgi:hypothetical protein